MTKWRGPDIDSVNVNYDCNYQSFRFKTRLDDLPKLCRFHHFLTTLFLTMKWSPQILLLRCLHVRTKWMLMVMHPLTSVAFWPLVTWTFSSFPGAIVMPDWYFLSRNHNDHINPLGLYFCMSENLSSFLRQMITWSSPLGSVSFPSVESNALLLYDEIISPLFVIRLSRQSIVIDFR